MEKPGKAEPQTAAIVKGNKRITKKSTGGGGEGREEGDTEKSGNSGAFFL